MLFKRQGMLKERARLAEEQEKLDDEQQNLELQQALHEKTMLEMMAGWVKVKDTRQLQRTMHSQLDVKTLIVWTTFCVREEIRLLKRSLEHLQTQVDKLLLIHRELGNRDFAKGRLSESPLQKGP